MLWKPPTSSAVFLPQPDEEHELGPTSKLPIYKAADSHTKNDYEIAGSVYECSQIKAKYDINLVMDVINKSKRFNNIKPVALAQILGEQRKYNYLKKFAIERLEETLQKQLHVLSNLTQCEKTDFKPNDELSQNIFSWGWNDFLARRKLKSFVWVDIMKRTTESCLHIYKFHKDLEQLQEYVDKVFQCLVNNLDNEEFDIYETVKKPIDEAKKVLHTSHTLEDELNENSFLYWQLVQTDNLIVGAKRESEERFLKTYLQNRIMNSHIWTPIEIRYNLNWFYNIVDQNQYRLDSLLAKNQRDSDRFKYMTFRENDIDNSCMDYFYTTIDNYKNRLNEIQDIFDIELEAMNTKLDLKRSQIFKLNELRKSFSEEITRFHKEEEIMAESQQRKLEEYELQLRLEEEELDAKMLNNKKIKKRSKSTTKAPKPKK